MGGGALFVVATPLGNLGDLSSRAAQVLREADVVAAEDTRRSRVLLEHVGAHPRVLSFHAHSKESRLEELADAVACGKKVALLTDAGTPAVSDPGAALVRRVRAEGGVVFAIPGPSAVVASLSVSGFPADRFLFLGFLPRRGTERRRLLAQVSESPWTTVIFEAPPRLVGLLEDLRETCGEDREVVVTRELTKLHEEVKGGTLADLAVYYRETPPRGEITLLVAGGSTAVARPDEDTLRARARELLDGGKSRRDVADQLASEFKVPRKEAYKVVTSG